MNAWLLVVLLILITGYGLELTVALLNLKALCPTLPGEFIGSYNADDYRKSQEYTRDTTRLSLISSTFDTGLTLVFLLLGGFNSVDRFAQGFGCGEIATGLIYTGTLLLLLFLIHLPFTLYSTFVIEERFGFNRTTLTTYLLDLAKITFLLLVLGAPLLALVLWFFHSAGDRAWLYCWAVFVAFSFIVQFLAPVLIMPLFNKFSPLADGPLRDAILAYAKRENFKLEGIYTMDGSKRSTKLNAFFTGFGRFRKIVFFDTLIEKLDDREIVAVLAHEMGHCKLHHVPKMLLASILQMGLMFFLLSLVLLNQGLFDAFSMQHVSIYASLVFFAFLYSPVDLIVSLAFNHLSRKHEYEADHYAVRTTGEVTGLIDGLKKLCQANLANLTPHPLEVFFHHGHPPVLERIRAIRASDVSK